MLCTGKRKLRFFENYTEFYGESFTQQLNNRKGIRDLILTTNLLFELPILIIENGYEK